MGPLLFVLRAGVELLAALLGAGALIALVFGNWILASSSHLDTRLQWYVTVQENTAKGSHLSEEALRLRLERLPTDGRLWSTPAFETSLRDAIGKYALTDLNPGQPLPRNGLSIYAPATSSPGNAVVSVEVSSNHVVGLQPGMWVAFAKDGELVPKGKRETEALRILWVSNSNRDKDVTTVGVEVAPCVTKSVPKLSDGKWRPVIVPPMDVSTTPRKSKKPRVSRRRRSTPG